MKKWDNIDISLAIELITKGNKYEIIATELDRTAKSVRLKLNRLGYSYNEYKDVELKEIIECRNCQKEIETNKSNNRIFCSKSCSVSYNNTKRAKSSNECKNCNKELKGRNKRMNTYCDTKCHKECEWNEKKEDIEKGLVKTNTTLRKYVIEKEGYICVICKETEWNGKEIPLVLDHISGDPYDNLPSNLRMICPNCDAQTDTYKGKNAGNGRHERMKRYHEGKSY